MIHLYSHSSLNLVNESLLTYRASLGAVGKIFCYISALSRIDSMMAFEESRLPQIAVASMW